MFVRRWNYLQPLVKLNLAFNTICFQLSNEVNLRWFQLMEAHGIQANG